jgi:hypothetical protein
VRGRGGRAAAVGECGFIGFRYEVKKGGRWGVSQALLDEGGIKEVWTVLRFLYRGAWEGARGGRRPRVGRLAPEAGEA